MDNMKLKQTGDGEKVSLCFLSLEGKEILVLSMR